MTRWLEIRTTRGDRAKTGARRWVSRILRPRVGAGWAKRGTPEIGIEHEYIVRSGGTQIDFRSLIRSLDLSGGGLDPGDVYAHRQRIGTAITCDEAEAEVSTPPIALNRGVSSEIDSWVRAASHQLVEAVPNLDLEGCSSHISMSAPEAIAARAAGIFSRTFAPAVMLLMERQDSLGLLVRP